MAPQQRDHKAPAGVTQPLTLRNFHELESNWRCLGSDLSTEPRSHRVTGTPNLDVTEVSLRQALNDMYDLLAVHEVERRAPPSMRLRFGKRDMGWQVAQRSMPTLRLRFGKRNVDEADPILDHHDLIRKDARTPALRLRFGKRGASFGEEDMVSQEQ